MATCPKKMKLIKEDHVVDDQVEVELKRKKKTKQNDKEKKVQFNVGVTIIDQKPSEHKKDQAELNVAEALGKDSGKKSDKSDKPGTSGVLKESNKNKDKKTDKKTDKKPDKKADKKRQLALVPWKPFSMAALLKLPEEKIPIEKDLGSTGGEQNVDPDKKEQ